MGGGTTGTGKAQFGVPGLDDILLGGLTRDRLYLLEGAPGSGKTTLGLQFLFEGAKASEKGITLFETEEELRETAASHNWPISKTVDIFELVPPESLLDEKQQHEGWAVFKKGRRAASALMLGTLRPRDKAL